MTRGRHLANIGWAMGAALIVGCMPDPPAFVPDPPVIGHVWEERVLVASGGDEIVGLGDGRGEGSAVRITVPAGALPAGTRLVVRVIGDLERPAPFPAGAFSAAAGGPHALHVLPADVVFARPLRASVAIGGVLAPMIMVRADVYFAREDAAAWTRVGDGQAELMGGQKPGSFAARVSGSLTGPGLWTITHQLVFPPSDATP